MMCRAVDILAFAEDGGENTIDGARTGTSIVMPESLDVAVSLAIVITAVAENRWPPECILVLYIF